MAKLLLLCVVIFCLPTQASSLLEQGRVLFHQGLLPSGELVRATVLGDIPVSGAQLACANCHRRSGLGSSEGRVEVPPIDYPSLYQPHPLSQNERRGISFQGEIAIKVFDDEKLAKAIRDGIDRTGNRLDEVMPHYQLDSEAMAALVTYIKSMKGGADAGVTETKLHLATVVADDVSKAQEKAMLDVLTAFFNDKNANIRGEKRRSKHSPWTREWTYKSYRQVVLHTWKLSGPEATWPAQLQDYYQDQPIFAMVSGLAADWSPIETFCESLQMPCLLPNVEQAPQQSGYYSRYFSAGPVMEAKVLARYLQQQDNESVLQLSASDAVATAAARAFGVAYSSEASEKHHLTSESIEHFETYQTPSLKGSGVKTAVIWGEADDLNQQLLDRLALEGISQLCLSSTMMGEDIDVLLNQWAGTSCLVHPYRVVDRYREDVRTLIWMKRKGFKGGLQRIRFNTYFAAKLVSDAIIGIRGNFSRAFFLEKIEHMVDKALVKPDYAHVSLGPGQRYLSRGAYVVDVKKTAPNFIITQDWTIPE